MASCYQQNQVGRSFRRSFREVARMHNKIYIFKMQMCPLRTHSRVIHQRFLRKVVGPKLAAERFRTVHNGSKQGQSQRKNRVTVHATVHVTVHVPVHVTLHVTVYAAESEKTKVRTSPPYWVCMSVLERENNRPQDEHSVEDKTAQAPPVLYIFMGNNAEYRKTRDD